ncbi:MAG TPA: cytochrome c [Gammaproteobacteria bacterium]|nr:cytochrome c [Gammaproteobacteria bacterium]
MGKATASLKRSLLWFSVGFGAVLAGALLLLFSGRIDVSATRPHRAFTAWLFETARERSVQYRASRITVPDDLEEAARFRRGAVHYAAMCATCHGAPGREPDELAAGMMPKPPRLAETAHRWSPAELYVIVRDGVRMTGMPAWGVTHEESELWNIVAFVRALPQLTPQAYTMVTTATEDHHHDHHDQVHVH